MTQTGKVSSFQVSLSAFQTWQKCEQKYYFQYVRKLRPRDQFLAPALGRILHTYLEYYYEGLKENFSADDSHLAALLKTSEKFIPEIRGYVNVALATGNEQMAKDLNDLSTIAGRIAQRYFIARGKADAERYKVIHVERWLNLPIFDGIHSTGVADLVTQDLETGRINLWEHKSTQNVPQDSVRLRDFQTMLYAVKLRWLGEAIIDSVVWNYMRTREPTVPEVLKSGQVTKRKDLDTTWEVYSQALSDAGVVDLEDYTEMKERLFDRERTIFFPRYEQVIVVSENVLMDDYIEESKRMRQAREDWEAGRSKPIKTISRDCDYCEFFRICQASLTGGDEEDVIRLRFTGG